ncbi:MAG TPA: NADH-quinone oxidoreductase subunit J [Chthonomonadaceae bacterium]|nr:NADH-quinone oxidoreductase subunit J [Chthonomonadaceae bacterium]
MSSLAAQVAFYSLAALTLIPALMVVRARSVVHAGFWLLPCFVGVAGFYAALEAHFFFVVQLLIYAGAILVLILFALMLTRDVMNPHVPQSNRMGLLAGLICSLLGLAAAWLLASQSWPLTAERPAGMTAQTRALGDALIGLYAVPFEVASLLLLAALIGAIVLAKAEREPEPETPPLAEAVVTVREPVGVE